MSEVQAAKKRKVDDAEVEGGDGAVESGENHVAVDSNTREASTGEHAANVAGPSGTSENGSEIEQLRQALKAADDAVQQAKLARRALAERLAALGQPVVIEPLDKAWIEVKIELLRSQFEEQYEELDDLEAAFEDYPDEAKHIIVRVLRKSAAMRQEGCQFDRNGYIDPEGRWISFKPTEEEVRRIDWEDLKHFWD